MVNFRVLMVATMVATLAGIGQFSATAVASTATLTPPRSIATDCSVDVSSRLQAFFQRVPDNSRVELARDACYRIDRTVTLANAHGISIDGMNASMQRPAGVTVPLGTRGGNPILRLTNVRDVTLQRVHLLGSNTVSDKVKLRPKYGAWNSTMEADHGIHLQGVQRVTLQNLTVDAIFGDGVYIGGSDAHAQSSAVQLRSVDIDRNGRQGVAVTSARDVLLDNVTIAHSRRAGVDLEPHPGRDVSRIEIRRSHITSWLRAINSAGTGAVNDVYVHDNEFLRSAVPVVFNRGGPRAAPRQGWDVIDNTIAFTVRSSAAAMVFGRTSDVLVHGNRARFSLGSGLAVIAGSSTVTIECNLFAGAVPEFVTSVSSRVHTARNVREGAKPKCAKPPAPSWAKDWGSPSTPTSAKATHPPDKQGPPGHRGRATTPSRHGTPTSSAPTKGCRQGATVSRQHSSPAQTAQTARFTTVADLSAAASGDALAVVAVVGMFGLVAFGAGLRAGRHRTGRHTRG